MKNKNVRGILALALVTALSFGVIVGSKNLAISMGVEQNAGTAADVKVLEEFDVAGAEGIEKAVKTENGYMVTVKTAGYGGDIMMNVSFDEEGKNVTGVEVLEHSETDGLGSLIAEADFLSQFEGVAAPVFLPGMSVETAEESKEEAAPAVDAAALTLNDGTYEAKAADFDQNGFMDVMTMTVEGGKITSVVWDNLDADGNKKSVLSENGEYVMTEDGPTWKEQAESLAAELVAKQSMDSFAMNEQGKIDTVSGVSISIGGFVAMAEDCLAQASGEKAAVAALNDGTYEAKAADFDKNGFMDVMTMTVEGGKITSVVWDNLDADGNKKSVLSANGEYVMTEDGPTWKEQAEALAAELVAKQSMDSFAMNEQGKIDTVSGVSISIGGFVAMAEDCLAQASGEKVAVALNDGTYEAKAPEADGKGYTDIMTMTVEGGKITSVVWDCLDADGNMKSVLSENGEYVMTEDGPTWKEQAEALGAELVAKQTLDAFAMNEEGKIDTVSGVSISIGGFVAMAEDCLAQASGEKAAVVLNDGTYEAKAPEADGKGYTDIMTMTVEGGKITSVVWDCLDADGNKKSVLSENGEYVMTEDGPTWKEQAEALGAELVAKQTLDAFAMNEEGKIDTVSGVSISIGGFVAMAEDCLAQAAGTEAATETETEVETEAAETEAAAPQNGTQVDAVSGATISSTAAVTGINKAYEFLQSVK